MRNLLAVCVCSASATNRGLAAVGDSSALNPDVSSAVGPSSTIATSGDPPRRRTSIATQAGVVGRVARRQGRIFVHFRPAAHPVTLRSFPEGDI
jgi:hypothetical protein